MNAISRSRLLILIILSFTFFAVPAQSQQLIATVPTGVYPYNIAVNTVTDKIYVANLDDNTVTVIDGISFSTTTVPVTSAAYLAVNEITNKIYVAGFWGMTIIDGATNQTTNLNIQDPGPTVVNSATNRIYTLGALGLVEIDGVTLQTTTIPVGRYPVGVALNEITNQVYVINQQSNNLTIVDGADNSTTTFSLPDSPQQIVLDTYTDQIYIMGFYAFNEYLTKIDGATLSASTIVIGTYPIAEFLDVDIRTNKLYLALYQGQYSNTLDVLDGDSLAIIDAIQLGPRTPQGMIVEPASNRIYVTYDDYQTGLGLLVINGVTGAWNTVFTGNDPTILAKDSIRDRIYVGSPSQRAVLVVAGPSAAKLVPISPCRVVDTRQATGTFGGPPIQGGSYRDFPIPQGSCNIPAEATAYALNVTVIPDGTLGYLTVWPSGETRPLVSTMNSIDGRIKANATIVASGVAAGVSVYASQTTNVVLDIYGYFEREPASALAFYPVAGCRVVDTRWPDGSLGGPYLNGGAERDFPIPNGSCNIPSDARAYSFNLTALPHGGLSYLTVWPEGQPQPLSSTLNAPTGTPTANAAIISAGNGGAVAVYPTNDTDLLIDMNGYFAPPGSGGMSLYTVPPCRVLDTRQNRGAFNGTILIDLVDSDCGLQGAEAFVLNTTVVPRGYLGYLTIWPTTEPQPSSSTLNAWDGAITSNMVIVTDIDGWLDAYASNPTNLVVDAFGYFAP